jgi:hypothetical protein
MTDADRTTMRDVLALIRYYSRRGWNWLDAAEYTLARASGRWPV